jgi:acyl-CoA reductase-like NAD-dependent aldehyde dehydrogenase
VVTDDTVRQATRNRRKGVYEEAVQIIEREYASDLDLDTLARRIETSRRQLERVTSYVELAREEGEILAGGAPPDDPELAAGYYFRPTVIANVGNESRVCQEEIFGPVVAAIPFDDEDEAIAIANGVPFGLAAGVWTNDIRRAHRVSSRLQAGTVWINNYRTTHWQAPFGGYKQSGFGRENGLEALREFTQVKSVITDYSDVTADPFAF